MFDKKQFDLEMDRVRREQIEDLADYLRDALNLYEGVRSTKIRNGADPKTLEKLQSIPISRAGRNPREVADELVENVFSQAGLTQHPRFFSFVPSAVSPYSLAGSVLTDIYNLHGGGYSLAEGACLIEEKLIKWMAGLASYPQDKCGGIFVSGGSMANMTALIAARNARLGEDEYPIGTAYLSDQTHSSVVRGLRLIGLRKDQIIIIPTDDDFRMRTDLLEEHIKDDIKAGKKPFAVVGTIGTTNTGSIDPLPEIGEIAEKYGLWFHIDGAYGGSILFSDIYRNYAKGIERSDSLSWDTHKWALQTYSCSCIIAKDKNMLLNAFAEHPEYLEDIRSLEHNDPWDMGAELTRPHRALKLWFTVQAMGTDRLADVIDYSFYNCSAAVKKLKSLENWEITSKPMCAAVTFRYAPSGLSPQQTDDLNGEISRRITDDGYAYIVTTTIKNKRVLRMCLINGNTTEDDVISTIEYLDRIARELTQK